MGGGGTFLRFSLIWREICNSWTNITTLKTSCQFFKYQGHKVLIKMITALFLFLKTNFGLMYEQKSISLFANSVINKYLFKRSLEIQHSSWKPLFVFLFAWLSWLLLKVQRRIWRLPDSAFQNFPDSRSPIPDSSFQNIRVRMVALSRDAWIMHKTVDRDIWRCEKKETTDSLQFGACFIKSKIFLIVGHDKIMINLTWNEIGHNWKCLIFNWQVNFEFEKKNLFQICFVCCFFEIIVSKSQGQLLEMHLLESRLLDTFFKNVICSTQKVSTARQTKVCRRCTTFRFWAVDKKSASAQIFKQMTKFLLQ